MYVPRVVSPTAAHISIHLQRGYFFIGICAPCCLLIGDSNFPFPSKPTAPTSPPPRDIQVPRDAAYDQQAKMMEAWIQEDYYLAAGDINSRDDVLESGGGSASGGPSFSAPAIASTMRVRLCVVLCIPLL